MCTLMNTYGIVTMDSRMHSALSWRQFAASIQCNCVNTVYRYWDFAQPCLSL